MAEKEPQNNFAIYLRLLKAIKPYRFIFLLGVIGTLLGTGIDAWIAWAVKPLLDKGLVAREHIFIMRLPFFIVIIFIFRGITNFISDYYLTRVGRSVVMDFRQQIFSHLLKLPASFYNQNSPGKLISLLVYNAEQVAAATTDALWTILSEGGLAIGLIVVMFVVSWQLASLFIIFAPLAILILNYSTKRLRKLSQNIQKSIADVTHIANECIDGYRVVRTYGGEAYENEKFAHATLLNRHRELKSIVTNSLSSSLVQIIAAIPIAIIVYAATSPHLNISVGAFGAMTAAILRILTPLRRVTKVNTTIQKGIAGAQTIYELLDHEPEKDFGTKSLTKAKGEIEFQNISFTYPGTSKSVLNELNFTIEPGKVIALVGHSGSGKSTLVSLLPRFYDVNTGTILIDGVNIQEYRLNDLRNQIAFVSQHINLFNDTIKNNIAYGSSANAKDEDIFKAASAANLLEVILDLPNGLDAMVGDNGLLLSGGQRQRIAIARAILRDAPILILDEATSSLDNESERYFQNALEKLMHKRTTLVIAHRLSTVERADCILVLEHGKIVESGTHSELIKLNGQYAKLYNMQFCEVK